MRNPNGFGSISKLTDKKRRKPFVVRITTGYDETSGKQKRLVLGYFATKKDAMQALTDYNANGIIIKSDMTLEQIYNEWSNKKYPHLSKQAVQCNQAAWQKFVSLANIPIINIRTAQLQKIIDNNSDMSLSSLQKVKTLAGQLFKYALQNDIVKKNYAQFIEVSAKNKTTVEKQIFSDLQLQQIENLAKQELAKSQPLHFASILILCYTGFRISEFLQLTNPFSLVRDEHQNIIGLQGGLKTEAGKNRIVPVHSKIQPYINVLAAAKFSNLYCPNGKPINANYYRKFIWQPCMEQLNISNMTPHNCRHTFASLCEKAELTPVKIEKLLGHSNYQMSKHYTHTELTDLQNAVNKL